jgi:hypothetical protein
VFDYVVINDDLQTATADVLQIASQAYGSRPESDLPSDHSPWRASEMRSNGGGTYYNPPGDVYPKGRSISLIDGTDQDLIEVRADAAAHTYSTSRLFRLLSAYVADDEVLIGLYSTGSFELASVISDAVDLIAYEAQVQNGSLTRSGYFAMSADVAEIGVSAPVTRA